MSSEWSFQSAYPIQPIGCGAKFLSGYAFKSQDFCDKGIPVIKIKNIQDRIVTTIEAQCIPQSLVSEKLKKFLLTDGDVLIAMTGQGSVGRVGRMQCRRHESSLMNQRVGKFLADESIIHKDYLYYVISSKSFEQIFFTLGSGMRCPRF